MAELDELLDRYLAAGWAPVACGDQVEVAARGFADVEHSAPIARDSIYRIASLTKPISAAALLMLVDGGGLLALDTPIAE